MSGVEATPPTPFRDYVPPELWHGLLRLGDARRYLVGQNLCRQGDPGQHIYLMVSGRVKVVRVEADGSQALLAFRGSGDLVGEAAVLDGGPRSATVTATAASVVHIVGAARFRRFVADHRLSENLTKFALARLREADQLRTELATMSVGRRLARTLVRLAVVCGRTTAAGVVLEHGLPQEELAQAVGASRNAVVGELARFRRLGLLRTARRQLVIRDLARLRVVARGGEQESRTSA